MSEKTNRPKGPMGQRHGGFGRPTGGAAEKAKDFGGTVRRLMRYLQPQVPKLILVLCFAVASTVFTVRSPKIVGDATNQLTDGFIAKSTVSGVSEMQKKMVPSVQDMLRQLQDGQDKAIAQADEAVEQQFQKTVDEKKQQAYGEAVKKADSVAEQKFGEAVAAQKQQAYSQAVAQADAAAEQGFNKTVAAQKQQAYNEAIAQADAAAEQEFNKAAAAQKQQAYSQAVAQADARFAGMTMTPQLEQQKQAAEAQAKAAVDAQFAQQLANAKKQAEAQAKAAVDAEFTKQQSAMQAQLASVKKQAETQAKAAVDAEFAKQQSAMQAQLADAKKQAEAQAKAAVDAEFAKQQSAMRAQLADAKKQAEAKVREEVNKAALEKGNMTQAQFDAIRELADLPDVSTIKNNNELADTVQKMFDLSKKLPKEYLEKSSGVSQSDLDKGIDAIRKYGGSIPFGEIGKTLMWLLAVFGLSALSTFAMQFIMSDVAQKTVFVLRREVDEKLERLPLSYFDSNAYGDILSRMTNDIDTVSSTLQQSLTQIITSSLQIIGYVWMMLTINLVLTLIVLATLPLYLVVTMLITKRSQKYYAAQQKFLGKLSGHTEEMFTGHVIVKAFGHEQDSVRTFQAVNDDLYGVGWKAQFMSGIMMPLMNFIGNVGYVLIAVVGGVFVTKSYLGLGDIVAFISYSKSFSQPITMVANIANVIQSTVACAERVFELLDEKEEIPDAADAVALSEPKGNIRFDHVQFRYQENVPLMEDMNLNIEQGDTVAIVGPTGAGKTTLVNLLMRFYEIRGGSITFDGTDIRKLRRGNLRTLFGMVLQDTWLFNGTIRDNIAYGREGAANEEIVAAAKAAHADHFIRSLPEGYDTILNEEASNISQGQKQLLTIARAILADPSVLILDEATSNVDTRTEVLIQKAMGVLMKGRTNFVIAHRLSTIKDAKMILVMNHGTIIEKGSHRELLAKGGFYADLYNSQFTGADLSD